jgi:hypothetical protein
MKRPTQRSAFGFSGMKQTGLVLDEEAGRCREFWNFPLPVHRAGTAALVHGPRNGYLDKEKKVTSRTRSF